MRWLISGICGVLPAAPVLWLGAQQRHQVAYIPEVGFQTFGPYLAVVVGGVAAGAAVLVLSLFSLPLRRPAAIYLAWALLPALALVLVSLLVPMFLPRYLLFTLPAWALLAGTALARLRPPWPAAGLVVIMLMGISPQLAMRRADGHEGEATRDLAAVVAAEARPGDAVVYAESEPGGAWTTRDAVAHYLPPGRRPADLLLTRPPRTDGQLLAGECAEVSRCLGHPQRVWVIRLDELADPLNGLGAEKEKVLRGRYRVTRVWHPAGLTLALLVGKSPAG